MHLYTVYYTSHYIHIHLLLQPYFYLPVYNMRCILNIVTPLFLYGHEMKRPADKELAMKTEPWFFVHTPSAQSARSRHNFTLQPPLT